MKPERPPEDWLLKAWDGNVLVVVTRGFTPSDHLRSAGQAEVRDAASELDGLGFRALWIPGGDGTRVFGDLGPLLQAAPHTAVALGVLGIWGYDPAEVGEHLHPLDRAQGRTSRGKECAECLSCNSPSST